MDKRLKEDIRLTEGMRVLVQTIQDAANEDDVNLAFMRLFYFHPANETYVAALEHIHGNMTQWLLEQLPHSGSPEIPDRVEKKGLQGLQAREAISRTLFELLKDDTSVAIKIYLEKLDALDKSPKFKKDSFEARLSAVYDAMATLWEQNQYMAAFQCGIETAQTAEDVDKTFSRMQYSEPATQSLILSMVEAASVNQWKKKVMPNEQTWRQAKYNSTLTEMKNFVLKYLIEQDLDSEVPAEMFFSGQEHADRKLRALTQIFYHIDRYKGEHADPVVRACAKERGHLAKSFDTALAQEQLKTAMWERLQKDKGIFPARKTKDWHTDFTFFFKKTKNPASVKDVDAGFAAMNGYVDEISAAATKVVESSHVLRLQDLIEENENNTYIQLLYATLEAKGGQGMAMMAYRDVIAVKEREQQAEKLLASVGMCHQICDRMGDRAHPLIKFYAETARNYEGRLSEGEYNSFAGQIRILMTVAESIPSVEQPPPTPHIPRFASPSEPPPPPSGI